MNRHSLTQVDMIAKTALCAVCGVVEIRSAGANRFRCVNKVAAKSRAHKYRKKYGIEIEQTPAAEVCEVCGGSARIAYDHDHQTGKFRGWLCMKCNTALGLVNDDIIILEKLIDYLQKQK